MSDILTSSVVIIYIIINIAVFLLYGYDKFLAKTDGWRIPEKTLLTGALFGPFGAYLGMTTFHHKTRKAPFTFAVPLFIVLHLIIAGYLLLM